ncbi:hypothetical protein BGX26_003952 [Mortierella sp. AD094]|nr:hypothetical protein BGX26_003952 [Mortierella sp. AD094]
MSFQMSISSSSSSIAVETSSTLPPPLPSTSTFSSQHSHSNTSPSSPASTSSSPEPTSTSTHKTNSPPVVAIAGAVVGVIVVMTLIAIWAFLRRRKSHPSKTSPSISPKGRDLEQQLNLYYNDNNNNKEDSSTRNAPKHSLYSLRRSDSHASKKHNAQQSSTNVTNTQATTLIPTVPLARDPIPPRISSSAPSVRSLNITPPDERAPTPSHKQTHRRQSSVQSITIPLPTNTPPVPPLPPVPSTPSNPAKIESQRKSTVAKPQVQEQQQPIDCHIDMVNVDVESLMPVIITDELQIQQQPNNTPIQSQQQTPPKQTPKQQNQHDQQQQDVNSNAKDSSIPPAPIVSSIPIMPTPTPRRPSLPGRKSMDSSRNRISMSFLPPPPPPSVPPPAVPMTYPGGIAETRARASTESSTHAIVTRGRKLRASMESISSAGRRSISLDSTNHREVYAQEMAARSKANNSPSGGNAHRTSKKIILPPTTPPPASVVAKQQQQQQQAPMHARRQHQKSPSQILSTGFFASPDRSPLSPLSPPLSPLTIQIPRNMPPRSNSAQATYANGPAIQNRPDSPTAESNNPSPSQSIQFQQQQLPSSMKTKAQIQFQNKRIRSKSVAQTEPQRVVIPPSSASGLGVGPRSPPMPAHLSDHLPPLPPVHSHLLHIRRPSLPQQQQQWLLNQQALSSGWEESSRPSTSTPTGTSASASASTARDDEERERELLQRRSRSFDSWMQQSYPTSPATPTAPESLAGSENHYSVIRGSVEKDLELQAIIANARKIAAGKIAAIEEARRSTWNNYNNTNNNNRRQQQQYQYHQGQRFAPSTSSAPSSRPWTPSEENWDASRPSFDDGFESEASSYYMTAARATRATPSPSRG